MSRIADNWSRVPKAKKACILLSCGLILSALACDLVDWRGATQGRLWGNVGQALMGLSVFWNLFMMYRFPGNKPAPNPLIGLFPKSPQLHNDEG